MGPPVVPGLIAALQHENDTLRSQVIKLLGKMGAEEALRPLSEMIRHSRKEEYWIAVDAARALGGLGKEGRAALRGFAAAESPRVRSTAIRGLVANRDHEFDLCRAFFDDFWSVCMAACHAKWYSTRNSISFWDCPRFQSYAYQANRLDIDVAVPATLKRSNGEAERSEPIPIMVAVAADGAVDHAWIMGEDDSPPVRAALQAARCTPAAGGAICFGVGSNPMICTASPILSPPLRSSPSGWDFRRCQPK
jgi:hypothetical protein